MLQSLSFQLISYTLFIQLHGITNVEQNVIVSIDMNTPIVTCNDDNATLIDSLSDTRKMLEYYLRIVKQWLERLAKYGCNNELTKYLIDIKRQIEIELDRCRELNVLKETKQNRVELSDDDLEDVPDEKEGNDTLSSNSRIV